MISIYNLYIIYIIYNLYVINLYVIYIQSTYNLHTIYNIYIYAIDGGCPMCLPMIAHVCRTSPEALRNSPALGATSGT
jgi:hypothetical protein